MAISLLVRVLLPLYEKEVTIVSNVLVSIVISVVTLIGIFLVSNSPIVLIVSFTFTVVLTSLLVYNEGALTS